MSMKLSTFWVCEPVLFRTTRLKNAHSILARVIKLRWFEYFWLQGLLNEQIQSFILEIRWIDVIQNRLFRLHNVTGSLLRITLNMDSKREELCFYIHRRPANKHLAAWLEQKGSMRQGLEETQKTSPFHESADFCLGKTIPAAEVLIRARARRIGEDRKPYSSPSENLVSKPQIQISQAD